MITHRTMYTHKWTRSAGTGNCIGKYTQAYLRLRRKQECTLSLLTFNLMLGSLLSTVRIENAYGLKGISKIHFICRHNSPCRKSAGLEVWQSDRVLI
jgi:hypothetical protein